MLISPLFNPDEFLHFPAVRHGIFMLEPICENGPVSVNESRLASCVHCRLGDLRPLSSHVFISKKEKKKGGKQQFCAV